MILISLILLTVFYYLLLWYLQRKRQAAFQAAALEVIGPTKSIELLTIDSEGIFGTTSQNTETATQTITHKKATSPKIAEQIERAALFEKTITNESVKNDLTKVVDKSEVIMEEVPQAATDIEIQQEAISDLKTKEDLYLIATELEDEETSETIDLTEENDLKQMMEGFGNFSELYQQEVQEIIGNNIKSTL